MKLVIGLDIGGTKCACLLADIENGVQILHKIRFDTRTDLGFEQTRDHLFEGIEELIALAKGEKIHAIGVSVGGPLDSRKGLIQSPPNLPGWDDIPLVSMLQERFSIPAYIQNDANACALVEWKLGAGRGAENMIFLTMGTGMGAGIIAEGRLLRGRNDMAGEVGHIRLSPEGPVGYGKEGSFEGFCSGGGIARLALMMGSEFSPAPEWLSEGASLTTKRLSELARSGDEAAQAVFAETGCRLGQALALFADILNPEVIVIGSVYARAHDLIDDTMYQILHTEALPHTSTLRILPAETGESIGDLAAIMVAQYALEK